MDPKLRQLLIMINVSVQRYFREKREKELEKAAREKLMKESAEQNKWLALLSLIGTGILFCWKLFSKKKE